MHVGALEIIVGVVIVFFGAIVQGSIGFGLNVLSAPVIGLVAPQMLPAAISLVALPTALSIAARERHSIDLPYLRWMLIGTIPGTLVGLAILKAVDHQELVVVVGAVTLVGVALSALKLHVQATPVAGAIASFVSNVFGTSTGVGGPPVGLLFQRHPGPTARATLGAFFVFNTLTSLISYPLVGELHGYQVLYGLILIPPMLAGVWASKHLHGHVDGGWLRPAVLVLSGIAGALAIVNGLI